MGMYVFQGEYTQRELKPSYKLSVIAISDGMLTTNEVFEFVLADTFKEIQLNAPRDTKTILDGNKVTWEIGTLNPDVASKDEALVLDIFAEYENELQEGDVIASNVINDFVDETGAPVQRLYEDFTFTVPKFKLDIILKSSQDCVYTLEFKATNLSTEKDLTDVSFNYSIDSDLTWISPLDDLSFTPTTWTVSNLAKNTFVTKEAIIRYTGDISVEDKTIFSPISGAAKYDRTKDAKYTGIDEYKQDVAPCPVSLECCEDCLVESADVIFTECDQSLTADVTPLLTSEGREIKVHVKLNNVCLAKDVVVGLELHEVISEEPRETIRRAFKVIHLNQNGEGCGERECNCATFYIPPKETASTDPMCHQQTFIVKAKAHHYYVNGGCECSTCNI